MNTVYLTSSILECVDRELVCEQKAEIKVCNLAPSMGTTILLLSILTSAMMLGYKIARTAALAFAHRFFGLKYLTDRRPAIRLLCYFVAEVETLRAQWNEKKKLEAERAALIAELEATLSPEALGQVQVAIQHARRTTGEFHKESYLASDQPSESEGEAA